MMILLEIEPLSKPVAIAEMLILLGGVALVGWFIGHLVTKGKIEGLQAKLAKEEVELEECLTNSRNKVRVATGRGIARDNLKVIEGIGPKIEGLLNGKGIYSFGDLAGKTTGDIAEILANAGPSFQVHNPGSWPLQAALARDGMWDELNILQDKLDGGREV